MENEVVTRIALKGSVRGSALLREGADAAAFELAVRGLPEGAVLLALGENCSAAVPLKGARGALPCRGIFALAVASGGRLAATGFSSRCPNRERALQKLRLLAMERAPSREPQKPQREKGKSADAPAAPKHDPAAQAKITLGFLEQARRLFEAQGDHEETEPQKARDPEPLPEPAENPFPRTFPNSVWQRLPGQERLFGTVRFGRRIVDVEAIPLEMKNGRARYPGHERVLIGRDGRRYALLTDAPRQEQK